MGTVRARPFQCPDPVQRYESDVDRADDAETHDTPDQELAGSIRPRGLREGDDGVEEEG